METTARVGIRELRQHLTVYIERVLRGETLRVTDRGHEVAILAPLPERASPVARLIANRQAIPATIDIRGIGLPPGRPGRSVTDTLLTERDES